jgi:hypothetical protein
MTWSDLDLDPKRPMWYRRAVNLKGKRDHSLPINNAARCILIAIREKQTRQGPLPKFVFPGSGGLGHQREVGKTWKALCGAAGLDNLHLHDLRHNFASILVSKGASLPQIGAMLAHASPATTQHHRHQHQPAAALSRDGGPPGIALRHRRRTRGFTWSGTPEISMKREWPDWTPPDDMLRRKPELPRHMAGGLANPLGARAMYLGDTLYRIHGSNEPETIGTATSSGCIRLTNDDVVDLYNRVHVGTKVVVLR